MNSNKAEELAALREHASQAYRTAQRHPMSVAAIRWSARCLDDVSAFLLTAYQESDYRYEGGRSQQAERAGRS